MWHGRFCKWFVWFPLKNQHVWGFPVCVFFFSFTFLTIISNHGESSLSFHPTNGRIFPQVEFFLSSLSRPWFSCGVCCSLPVLFGQQDCRLCCPPLFVQQMAGGAWGDWRVYIVRKCSHVSRAFNIRSSFSNWQQKIKIASFCTESHNLPLFSTDLVCAPKPAS